MVHNGQSQIYAAMERPDFYPHPVSAVEKRETHISKVFLTGQFVYKIKKPVDLGFLDFTTLEKRRHFCYQEVILNRRLAPDVYLGVIPITQKKDRYVMAGDGPAVEYAVKMRQLSQGFSLLRLLRSGKFDASEIEHLSGKLVEFYRHAPLDPTKISFGAWETVCANCEENFTQTEMFAGNLIDERMYQIVQGATLGFLHKHRDLFDARMAKGKIRDCHGDLRVGHIYFDDGIKIIDCIEFNDRFRYSDVACDLAFLAMDLDFEGFSEIERQLLQSVAWQSKDDDVFVLIDFYKCYRAMVRVKVNCLRLNDENLGEYERKRLLRETHRYMELAYCYALNIHRPALWVICGMIGSGKSTIAERLGRVLGLKVLHSDVIRKELFGLKPAASIDVPFGQGIYSEEFNRLTYGKMLMLAQEVIKTGASVIMDATFSRLRHRLEALQMAENLDADHILVECVAGLPVVRQRLLARETDPTISDARLHHLRDFRNSFEPLTAEEKKYRVRINTEKEVDFNIHKVLSERRRPCLITS